MKFLTTFLLILFSLNLLSCISSNEEGRRFRGRDKLKNTRKRVIPIFNIPKVDDTSNTANSQNTNQNDDAFVFPVALRNNHESLLLDAISNEKHKVSISANPKNIPVQLVAGFSGHLSISTNEGIHTLILSPPTITQSFYFELESQNTTLTVADGNTVKQRQALAETTGPITFYIKQDDELTILCFPLLPKNINVVKSFVEQPECQEN